MGTTTIAVNLAAAFAARKEKVALIDLNLFCGNVTSFLDLTPRYNLASITSNMERLDANFLMSVMENHSSGLHVLSGPVDLNDSAAITPEQLQEVIRVMRNVFTYTIIDTGGPIHWQQRADLCLLRPHPFHNGSGSAGPGKRQTLSAGTASTGRFPRPGQADHQPAHPKGEIKLADAEKILKTKAYMTVPNSYADIRASINKGQPTTACYPRSPVTKALNDLAQLLKKSPASTMAAHQRKTIL